jgi:hypothetical protein
MNCAHHDSPIKVASQLDLNAFFPEEKVSDPTAEICVIVAQIRWREENYMNYDSSGERYTVSYGIS